MLRRIKKMRIKDENGRIGIVTSETATGVFAKPENVPYKIDDKDGITGVANAILITATHWSRQPDGTLHGLWFDSPLHTFLTATVVPNASDMSKKWDKENSPSGLYAKLTKNAITEAAAMLGRKGGAVKSKRKAAASRKNGRKGGRPKK
jgi:hypothetical protein